MRGQIGGGGGRVKSVGIPVPALSQDLRNEEEQARPHVPVPHVPLPHVPRCWASLFRERRSQRLSKLR